MERQPAQSIDLEGNTLEAWNKFVEPKITSFEGGFVEVRDWIESTTPKLLELDGFGHAVEKAIGKANEVAAHADGASGVRSARSA